MTVHLFFHSVAFLTQNRLQTTQLPWPMLASFDMFRVFKYNIMHEHMRRQSLKLHMFFKIKYLLFKKKVVDCSAFTMPCGIQKKHPVHPSVQMSCLRNSFLMYKTILKKLYTVAVFDSIMCIQEDNPRANLFRGDN